MWLSGFLADELYWPVCKSITPALCFGFAVDGGGCDYENLSPRFRSIPKKCHCGQAGAVSEGLTPDAGDAVGDRDARQAGAVIEGAPPDASDAVTNRDARQAAAATEDATPDAGDAITNGDARQAFAA